MISTRVLRIPSRERCEKPCWSTKPVVDPSDGQNRISANAGGIVKHPVIDNGIDLGLTSYRISKGIQGNFESSPSPLRFSGCFPFRPEAAFLDALGLGLRAVTEPMASFSACSGP